MKLSKSATCAIFFARQCQQFQADFLYRSGRGQLGKDKISTWKCASFTRKSLDFWLHQVDEAEATCESLMGRTCGQKHANDFQVILTSKSFGGKAVTAIVRFSRHLVSTIVFFPQSLLLVCAFKEASLYFECLLVENDHFPVDGRLFGKGLKPPTRRLRT